MNVKYHIYKLFSAGANNKWSGFSFNYSLYHLCSKTGSQKHNTNKPSICFYRIYQRVVRLTISSFITFLLYNMQNHPCNKSNDDYQMIYFCSRSTNSASWTRPSSSPFILAFLPNCNLSWPLPNAVSYTHLTLPTIYSV